MSKRLSIAPRTAAQQVQNPSNHTHSTDTSVAEAPGAVAHDATAHIGGSAVNDTATVISAMSTVTNTTASSTLVVLRFKSEADGEYKDVEIIEEELLELKIKTGWPDFVLSAADEAEDVSGSESEEEEDVALPVVDFSQMTYEQAIILANWGDESEFDIDDLTTEQLIALVPLADRYQFKKEIIVDILKQLDSDGTLLKRIQSGIFENEWSAFASGQHVLFILRHLWTLNGSEAENPYHDVLRYLSIDDLASEVVYLWSDECEQLALLRIRALWAVVDDSIKMATFGTPNPSDEQLMKSARDEIRGREEALRAIILADQENLSENLDCLARYLLRVANGPYGLDESLYNRGLRSLEKIYGEVMEGSDGNFYFQEVIRVLSDGESTFELKQFVLEALNEIYKINDLDAALGGLEAVMTHQDISPENKLFFILSFRQKLGESDIGTGLNEAHLAKVESAMNAAKFSPAHLFLQSLSAFISAKDSTLSKADLMCAKACIIMHSLGQFYAELEPFLDILLNTLGDVYYVWGSSDDAMSAEQVFEQREQILELPAELNMFKEELLTSLYKSHACSLTAEQIATERERLLVQDSALNRKSILLSLYDSQQWHSSLAVNKLDAQGLADERYAILHSNLLYKDRLLVVGELYQYCDKLLNAAGIERERAAVLLVDRVIFRNPFSRHLAAGCPMPEQHVTSWLYHMGRDCLSYPVVVRERQAILQSTTTTPEDKFLILCELYNAEGHHFRDRNSVKMTTAQIDGEIAVIGGSTLETAHKAKLIQQLEEAKQGRS